MAGHSTLTGADLHELKGAAAAAANTVPVANGAGSTAFAKLTTSNLDTTSIFDANQFVLSQTMTDVSAPSTIYFVVPFTATLNKAWSILGGAITGADSNLTVKNNAGSTAGTWVVSFSGSAAGDIDSVTCSSNNTFTAGQMCTVVTDGASSTTATLFVVLSFTRTG